MKFDSLPLCKSLQRNLRAAGYDQPTPIQEKAIPKLLEGCDLIGCAQTGTGKTAAFALPMLQRLIDSADAETGVAKRRKRSGARVIQALILAPTRELACQIGDSLTVYGQATGQRHVVIYGGVGQSPQVRALKAGVNTLVATPGRLLDLIGQGYVKLGSVEVLVLDEADQMLDMGFIHDLRKIVAQVPKRRQTLMFSATMPKTIRDLAQEWLHRPHEVKVAPIASTPELVSQSVVFVEKQHKVKMLTGLLQGTEQCKTLVFSRTKRGADKIARVLQREGIRAVAIHGDKSQSSRRAAMRQFDSKRPPVLVATDLAARGLDFTDVTQVINYDLPDVPEIYVHRIGRTARAGATGQALSFCSREERPQLKTIERLTGHAVTVVDAIAMPKATASKQDENSGADTDVVRDSDNAAAKKDSSDKPRPRNRSRGQSRSRRGSSGGGGNTSGHRKPAPRGNGKRRAR